MKPSSISNNWVVPGAKFCVHENGMTAVVSEIDSVYLYEGRKGEQPKILAFNSKSGQVVYRDEKGGERELSMEEMKKQETTNRMLEKGSSMLASGHYSQPQSEEEKIHEWMESLLERPAIERKELKNGHHLVAFVRKFTDKDSPEGERIGASFYQLGDPIVYSHSDTYYDERIDDVAGFKVEQDSDLSLGVRIEATGQHNIKFRNLTSTRTNFYSLMDGSTKEVALTREEARWIRELLPPYPVKRFLHAHEKMQEAEEGEKRKRGLETMRNISRSGAGRPRVGKVGI